MRLFSITAIVEAADGADAKAVEAQIARAICPHPPESDHACARGWITMMHELDADEAAAWAEPGSLNR